MNTADLLPINSQDSTAMRLCGELKACLNSRALQLEEVRDLVAWCVKYGHSLAVPRAVLEHALLQSPDLHSIAVALTDNEVSAGKPPMEFMQGQEVEVIVNARNLTYHRGTVRSATWHFNEQKWMYLLEEAGRRVSKRYEARDLRAT